MIEFDDDPPSGSFAKWVGGAVVPLAIAVYGLSAVVSQQATIPSRRFRTSGGGLLGGDAVALGIAALGAAIVLHCYFFWGNTKKLAEYSVVGRIGGAVIFSGGIGVLLFRLLNLV